jgi:hypothetical protein
LFPALQGRCDGAACTGMDARPPALEATAAITAIDITALIVCNF